MSPTRYFTTLRLFWSASLSAELEYRANFAMAALTSLLTLAGSLFVLSLFYQHGYEMGGYAWPQALVVIAIYTILEGSQAMLMAPNRTRITQYVREGTLDFVLLKPIDSQFWLSFRNVSVWGAPNILMGIAILIYALNRPDQLPVYWSSVLLGLLPLAFGLIILYSLGFILSTLTIWFVKLWNITIAMDNLLEAGRYPVPAYPVAYRFFFTFVLPVAFMTTVPADVILNRSSTGWLFGAAGVALTLLLISRWFWRFALRYYTSASS